MGGTAFIGKGEVEAHGVLLTSQATQGGEDTALLIQCHTELSALPHSFAGQTLLTWRTLLRELDTVQWGDGREDTGEAKQRNHRWYQTQ